MAVCFSCPRHCGVERLKDVKSDGFCQMPYNAVLARADLHFWEEPVISGKNGSGTIFFSGCSLRCVFCQNFEISHNNFGKTVTIDKFIEIIKNLEQKGANNINLVNPSHFVPFIKEALTRYKPVIPVIYNSGGYDSVESLKSIEGLIDIYLPDIKYFDNDISAKYSKVSNYFEYASKAVLEMQRQVGKSIIESGLMKKGLIIRHLVLPQNTNQSIKILNWIKENMPIDTYISIMSQYTPYGREYEYKELNRKIVTAEYQKVIDEFNRLGFVNGFMQQRNSAKEEYTPDFDLTGI